MTGTTINQILVLDRAPTLNGRRWWCLCLRCRHQWAERATSLRRAMRGDFVLVCLECGA